MKIGPLVTFCHFALGGRVIMPHRLAWRDYSWWVAGHRGRRTNNCEGASYNAVDSCGSSLTGFNLTCAHGAAPHRMLATLMTH